MATSPSTNNKQPRHRVRLWASLLVLLALSWGIATQDWFEQLTNTIGYAGFFLLAMVSSATFVIPGPIAVGAIAGAKFLNPLLLGLCMGVGSGLGEFPGYLVGRLNQDELSQTWGARTVVRWMSLKPRVTLFFLAAVPNFLYDFASLTAGAAGINAFQFLLLSILGKIVRFGAIALVSNCLLG